MITQQEIRYIYDNWLPHQTLFPHYWGESEDIATPFYYLAIQRNKHFMLNTINKNIISAPVTDFYSIKTYDIAVYYSNYLRNKNETIIKDWIHFLNYKTITDYLRTIEIKESFMKTYILEKLTTYLSEYNENNNERIYTL